MTITRRRLMSPVRLAGLALCGLMLAGCGQPGFLVSIEQRTSDLFFGAAAHKAKPSPSAPPAAPVSSVVGGVNADLLPSQDFYVPPAFNVPTTPHDTSACPTPPVGTPLEGRSPNNVDAAASNGTYRWYASYELKDANGRVLQLRNGFENRYVTAAAQLADTPSTATSPTIHHFTFDALQPDPSRSGQAMEIDYNVNTWSSLNNPGPVYDGNNDPDAGVTITAIKWHGETYTAAPHLLVETLPIQATNGSSATGDATPYTWDFPSADPSDHKKIELSAVPNQTPEVVNVCGRLIEGWAVDGTLTTIDGADPNSAASPYTLSWHYVIATQYGGIIVAEKLSGQTPTGAFVDTDEHLASLDVKPLPVGISAP